MPLHASRPTISAPELPGPAAIEAMSRYVGWASWAVALALVVAFESRQARKQPTKKATVELDQLDPEIPQQGKVAVTQRSLEAWRKETPN